MSDQEILRQFLGDREAGGDPENAFRQLVDRYSGLVYSIALRKVRDPGLAEDVAQNVFTTLARKAARLKPEVSLAGWLHRAAMLESARALRTEMRRARKIKAFEKSMKTEVNQHGETPDWNGVLPSLDEALHRLSARDRDLILQHYLEGRSYVEIARRTGRSKAACSKQGNRVLQKLCRMLKRDGVHLSAAAVGAGIAGRLAENAPVGLAQSLCQGALTTAATSATPVSLLSTLTTIMTTTKFTGAAALMAVGAMVPISMEGFTTSVRSDQSTTEPAVSAITSPSGLPAMIPQLKAANPSEQGPSVDLVLLEKELKKLPFPDEAIERQLDLERLMFELTESDVPKVAAMLEQLEPGSHLIKVTTALYARWSEFDPVAAATRAEEIEDRWLLYAAREGAIETWAATDPAAALAYLEKIGRAHV